MAGEEKLGTAVLELTTDNAGLDRGLKAGEQRAGAWVARVGGVLGKGLLVGAGVAVAGGAALVGVLGDAVSEAVAAQQATAQLEAVLKSTGGAAGVTSQMANELATALSKVTRFEDDSIVAGESMLLTFTNIGKDVFPDATTAMLDLSQAMGQDLKSTAVQLGKALNDPIKGITALTRVGVTFTDAQKQQIAAMVKAGRTADAQRIILAELRKEFGGSAEAAGRTFAGQMDIFRNNIGNIKEDVGNALLPAITELANALGPVLTQAATGFGEWLKTAGPRLAEFATNVGNIVGAISQFGIKSPEARAALQGLFGEDLGGKIADVSGWISTAATNMGYLRDAVSDAGWESPEAWEVLDSMFGPEWATRIQNAGSVLRELAATVAVAPKNALGDVLRTFQTEIPAALLEGKTTIETYLADLRATLGITPDVSGWYGIAGFFVDLANKINAANTALTGLIDRINAAIGASANLPLAPNVSGPAPGTLPGLPGYQPPKAPPGGRPGFAGGTLSAPGGWSLVGERGPELLNIPRGSQVFNAQQVAALARGGGGVTVNGLTIHVPSGDPAAVSRATQDGLLRAARAMGLRG